MRCGEGFLICYSITDRRSFQEASEYRKLIGRVRLTQDIPLVLIANKLDLSSQRAVTTEEGRSLASEFGCPFYETSACLRHYIDDVFYTLVREIRKKENKRVSGRDFRLKGMFIDILLLLGILLGLGFAVSQSQLNQHG